MDCPCELLFLAFLIRCCAVVGCDCLLMQDMSLLSCLSSLGVDTWAQVLLPKLIAHGSAQAVASTCSQLRDLCFGSVQHIDLSSVQESSDTSKMEYWVQPIPQHFKNITSVQLSFDEETSYHSMAYLLPALQE